MSDSILEVKNLVKTYDNGTKGLKGISFQINPGEFVGIIGLSGSGKSTLLRCLNRLIEPTSGQILFKGIDLVKLNASNLRERRKNIGMVFQHFNLVKRRSVISNVLSGRLGSISTLRSLFGFFTDNQKKEALEKLKIVGLENKAYIRADQLSGGQQQRVAIARTLMQNPDLILADEPVASLDPATSHNVMDYLKSINKNFGKTVICNLHFLSLVREYCSRVIALKAGEVVYDGPSSGIDENWFKKIYGESAKEVEIH